MDMPNRCRAQAHRTGLLVLALLAAGDVAARPQVDAPTEEAAVVSCDTATRALIDCRANDWRRWSDAELDVLQEPEQVAALLDDLLLGRAEAEVLAAAEAAATDEERRRLLDAPVERDDCLVRTLGPTLGCSDEECVAAHLGGLRCDATAVVALAQLGRTATERSVRLGAAAMAYSAVMAEPPSEEDRAPVARALEDLALELLGTSADPIERAAALLLVDFLPRPSIPVTSRVARLMSSPRPLVRPAAIDAFYRLTGCPLMDDWPRDAAPSAEQVAEAQAWWAREGIAAASSR